MVAHKETRFLLPVAPFIFVTIAELMTIKAFPRFPFLAGFILKLYIVIELITIGVITFKHERASLIRLDLLSDNLHSFYSTDVYNTPVYALLHRTENPVKIYSPNKAWQFAQTNMGSPLPTGYEKDFNLCV